MSRKKHAIERPLLPDARYNSLLVARFINNLMKEGKKSTAETVFYDAMDIIAEKVKDEQPVEVFKKALDNIKPVLEVKSRRVGGANYQVPIEVRPARRQTLAFRWLLLNSRKRPERNMAQRLALELVDAFNNTGLSIKKKEDTHKMAEANKAFAHYRW
jgi:small subunit ribosomal protein S7